MLRKMTLVRSLLDKRAESGYELDVPDFAVLPLEFEIGVHCDKNGVQKPRSHRNPNQQRVCDTVEEIHTAMAQPLPSRQGYSSPGEGTQGT